MRRHVVPMLVAALLGLLVVWGIALRLQDPLSTRALGAEDPYTHVVFTKEWMSQGFFADSFNLGTEMYPPGMHAFVGIFTAFAGISLYDFARVAPALIGGVAILGMYALGSRLANPAAGLAAAFLAAIMPEHIFRTELLFPTAFDLALLPFWLLSFHMMLEGETVPGAVLFAGASVPLAIMHPWAVPLFGVPLGLYAALRVIRGRLPAQELVIPYGILVAATAFAMAFRWKESGTGFADFLAHVPGLAWLRDAPLAPSVVFLGALFVLAPLALAVVGMLRLVAARRPPLAIRIGLSVVVGALLLALVIPLTANPPQDVSYRDMLGPIALAMALAGFALAFARPSALGDLGASIAIFLLPLTALDVFGSPYWPQRTVAYLAIGVVLLGASVVGALADLPNLTLRSERARRIAAPTVLVALALVAAGAATAMPADTYKWYRLYHDDSFAGFEHVARELEKDPDSKVFLGGWQGGLMVKTLTDPEHVWYSPKFFTDGGVRAKQLDEVQGPAYVLVERYTKGDTGFLNDASKYHLLFNEGGVKLYKVN